VTLGLRAEHVTLAAHEDAPGFHFSTEVKHVEDHGADALALVVLGGAPLLARVPPGQLRGGMQAVRLRLDLERLHLFDGESGDAL
jgi:ABC-type sugar transport system ATPase subunit